MTIKKCAYVRLVAAMEEQLDGSKADRHAMTLVPPGTLQDGSGRTQLAAGEVYHVELNEQIRAQLARGELERVTPTRAAGAAAKKDAPPAPKKDKESDR